MLNPIWARKHHWIGHVLWHNELLWNLMEGRMIGKSTRGRRRLQMLEEDDLYENYSYEVLKRTAEDPDETPVNCWSEIFYRQNAFTDMQPTCQCNEDKLLHKYIIVIINNNKLECCVHYRCLCIVVALVHSLSNRTCHQHHY